MLELASARGPSTPNGSTPSLDPSCVVAAPPLEIEIASGSTQDAQPSQPSAHSSNNVPAAQSSEARVEVKATQAPNKSKKRKRNKSKSKSHSKSSQFTEPSKHKRQEAHKASDHANKAQT
ncbi:UNVERIFIED_CONTAM: hypothetical protein Sindi_1251300 [Sesamum indicum]